jgi:hypothetical protein
VNATPAIKLGSGVAAKPSTKLMVFRMAQVTVQCIDWALGGRFFFLSSESLYASKLSYKRGSTIGPMLESTYGNFPALKV